MKEMLNNISENDKFSMVRRKIIVFRSFMQRAYQWIQIPSMILVTVGVLYPYVNPYIELNIWIVVIGILSGLGLIGYAERYLGFYKEDVTYNTEQNKILLNRFNDLETKLNILIDKEKQL